MISWDEIMMWWHHSVLKHRIRQDISREQMISWCSCCKVWITT
jgi:hypothetical protein